MYDNKLRILISGGLLAFSGALFANGPRSSSNTQRPNILWIFTDENRPDAYGCYGQPWAQTPTVDKIAARGVVMQNAYVQSPVCVPSRTSMLYALYPQELGVYDNRYPYKDGILADTLVPFQKVFENNGYSTANIGKWHTPGKHRWGYCDRYQSTGNFNPWGSKRGPEYEKKFTIIHRPKGTPIVLGGTYPETEDLNGGSIASILTDKALNWLESRDKEKPFLLRVSYLWPHTPSVAPVPFDTIYKGANFPKPYLNARKVYKTKSAPDKKLSDEQGGTQLTGKQWEWICQTYYGCVAYLDGQFERLYQYLEENGLLENTIVVLSSDHGRNLGEYGTCEKGTFDNEVWRIPFVISYPKKVPQGIVRYDLCEAIDHARTLLGLAGIDAPGYYRGRNLFNEGEKAPVAVYGMNERGKVKDASIAQYERNRGNRRIAVRTKDYRYDYLYSTAGGKKINDPKERHPSLYKITSDPQERHNLINDPKYTKRAKQLHDQLEYWFESLPYRSDGQ